MNSSQAFSGQPSAPEQNSTFLGKRTSSETSESEDVTTEISRLNERNCALKQQLTDSQEEVKRLTAVIEQHEIHKKAKQQEEKSQTRYWTDEEHQRFLEALQTLGPKDVKAISNFVGTRSATQVRTHAQKYFIKLARIKKNAEEAVQAGHPGAEQEAWWLQGFDSEESSTASGNKSSDKSDGKRRGQGLPGGLEGMDSGSIQALADMVGSVPVHGASGSASKKKRELEEPGSSASSDAPSRGGPKGGREGAAGLKANVKESGKARAGLGLEDLKKVSGEGRVKGMNLTSSSNEESGVTDGSSTHGNGSNSGSWHESGSNQSSNSLNNSDANGSSNNNSDSDKGASSTNSDGGSNNSDGGSERGGEREGSSERDGGEERDRGGGGGDGGDREEGASAGAQRALGKLVG